MFGFAYSMFLRNLFLSLICCFVFISSCFGMNSEDTSESSYPRMTFKLGFEFQEGSGLCPWALENYNIQKKPFFFFEEGESSKQVEEEHKVMPLWHVVIDTSDIEFVTRPFTDSKSLKTCVSTILTSLHTLQELFKSKKAVVFGEWVMSVASIFEEKPFRLTFSEHFDLVKNQLIIKPSEEWEPRFSPQVTIQHPLDYTIFLYFGLFGFNNPSHMFPFVASLPFFNLFLQFHKEADSTKLKSLMGGYSKKISGLAFLHALTMVQMTPNEDDTDSKLLTETHQALTNFQQVDAKMRLTLMSRRPFSSMLKDIKLPREANYSQFFFGAMVTHNTRFSLFYNVPTLFYRANYAEQYFDPHTGKEVSLTVLAPLFREEFVKENEDTLIKLLERGIVSTVMIRNLSEKVQGNDFLSLIGNPSNYFMRIVDSVASPKKRYTIDKNKSVIRKEEFTYDCLSPPEFLDLENSMGALKEKELITQEMDYGEAIVEIRGIKHIEDWFIRKTKLNPKIKGTFLTIPKENLIQEAVALFEFLEGFGTTTDIEDIQLGMTHAVFKN